MKPKVLFLLHLSPPVHGAAVVGGYIKKSKIINERLDATYINLATASSLSDIGKSSIKKYFVIILLWLSILRSLLKKKYGLCYFTINAKGAAWYKELVIVLLLKIFRVPIVYHYHNKGVHQNSKTRLKKYLYKFQFKNSKSILLSKRLYPDIQSFISESDVYYCPNGIPEKLLLCSNDAYLKKEQEVTILFLSNLIESKGVYTLLEACSILKKKQVDFKCVLIGGEADISANDFNKKVQQLDLLNCVSYQGKKYGIEKEKSFLSADIFAFPTFYENETFGLVNLEAMQFRLPIISTYEGGIPDLVQDGVTGYLVPSRNPTLLAEKLEYLINNPKQRRLMGFRGQKHFQAHFTLEIFEDKMNNTLHDILDKYAFI